MGGVGGSPPTKARVIRNQTGIRLRSVGARPVPPAVCLRGGNCNNGAKCGARCLNANNAASRANWNIGGSPTYPFTVTGALRPPTMQTYLCMSTWAKRPSRTAW